jgi:hypothetical protein
MSEPCVGEAYCPECAEKKTFVGNIVVRNDREFAVGPCPDCSTEITRILGQSTDPAE